MHIWTACRRDKEHLQRSSTSLIGERHGVFLCHKRMALGLYGPAGWRGRDSDLLKIILIRRDPPSLASGNKRPFDKAFQVLKKGGNPQATEICKNWNEGHCHSFCKFMHACKTCSGVHPVSGHAGPQTVELAQTRRQKGRTSQHRKRRNWGDEDAIRD